MNKDERDPDTRASLRLYLCRLLDRHGVAHGDKAIGRFLDEHWTADLAARFGTAAPRTIREWRKVRGRPDQRSYADMLDLRFASARRAAGRGGRRSHQQEPTTDEE